jgi:uncharacterized flavoprotein (TIGR03862 family)
MSQMHQKTAAVIGAGPAGLMAAQEIAHAGLKVTIFDRMPTPARKFLLAGRGGLNLTHTEAFELFLARYGEASERLRPLIRAFTPDMLRAWSEALGEPTFAGSSGRVFPKSFKASPLLRAFLRRLDDAGVRLLTRHLFAGFDDAGLPVIHDAQGARVADHFDAYVFALGGASWPKLGSDARWCAAFAARGLVVHPFKPANCGFEVDWSDHFISRFAGEPLKSVRLIFDGHETRGEVMVAQTGLEGGGIYALSSPLRDAILRDGSVMLRMDLRPDVSAEDLVERLSRPRGAQSLSSHLRKAAGLSPLASALLREAQRDLPNAPQELASLIKNLPVRLNAPRPLERAISSAGGIALDEVDDGLMLRRAPGLFVCGEMLDWEAPTGGYLLQACFATGFVAGQAAARYAKGS